MKVGIIIPSYNEEGNIQNVINSINISDATVDIIVINDGSLDKTSMIAKNAGAYVIDLPNNLGIGGAVQTGYLYCYNNDYDVAIQIDGDGQHSGEYINELILSLEESNADIVIGSRFIDKGTFKSNLSRKIGIKFFSKLVSLITSSKINDTTSGLRCINRKAIELFSKYYPSDYPEVETIVYAHKRGLSIKEIPVIMRQRMHGKSSISLLNGLYYMIKVTIGLLLIPKRNIFD